MDLAAAVLNGFVSLTRFTQNAKLACFATKSVDEGTEPREYGCVSIGRSLEYVVAEEPLGRRRSDRLTHADPEQARSSDDEHRVGLLRLDGWLQWILWPRRRGQWCWADQSDDRHLK